MQPPPALLCADIHAHPWSAFSTKLSSGVNSRLQIIIDELLRSAAQLRARGGNLMVIAGDLFHVRGFIDPEVFNPIFEALKKIAAMGIRIIILPGNHDLKSQDTTELGNATQQMGTITGVTVLTAPHIEPPFAFIPWCSNKAQLCATARDVAEACHSPNEIDLVIHAGISGVLPGLDHGLDSEEVASWGFRRVFAGDYHNHKILQDGAVISIGATTHQTWGDIGTRAGFLLVWPDRIEYQASHAPRFVEITGDDDPDEIPLLVEGNYVRIRGMKLSDADVNRMRAELIKHGAKGVTFQVAREVVGPRKGSTSGALTLDQSIHGFVDKLALPNAADIKKACDDILSTVRSVTA